MFLLEKGCRVLVSVLGCFRVECPVETEPSVEFSECHTANQQPPTEVVVGECYRITLPVETEASAGWRMSLY